MTFGDDRLRDIKPKDNSYLECGLPEFLVKSIEQMAEAWDKADKGKYMRIDCDFSNLQADINIAEVEQLISEEQAWYLREKYLQIVREEIEM